VTAELARNPNPDFTSPAPEAIIQTVTTALRANNIDARVVDTGEEARRLVLELVPEGAEVHSGKSKTLVDVGLFQDLFESGRYDSLRSRLQTLDRETQGREMRKLGAAPDYIIGSPIFDKVRLRLGNGKVFEIVARNNSSPPATTSSSPTSSRKRSTTSSPETDRPRAGSASD